MCVTLGGQEVTLWEEGRHGTGREAKSIMHMVSTGR